jgi:hypothetical protein
MRIPAMTRWSGRAARVGLAGLAITLVSAAMAQAQVRTGEDGDANARLLTTPTQDVDWLVSSAVLAAPEPLRAGAEVRGWTEDDHLQVLREGSNGIICLADRPGDGRFAAACYHESLEPFMERGRELTREGVEGAERDERRWAEIDAGELAMPEAAMVYNLQFPTEDFDPDTVDPATGMRLHSFYIRDATAASTGVTDEPGHGPWLMHAGTPSAHVMISLPRVEP